jgi:hypothetical protein
MGYGGDDTTLATKIQDMMATMSTIPDMMATMASL